jgi:hypothetical protein
LEQLSQALKREWQRIPQVRIQNLIRSLPWRCRIVLTAYGNHNYIDTDYFLSIKTVEIFMIYSAKYETHDGLKKWCVLQIDLFRNALVYWDQISQTDIKKTLQKRYIESFQSDLSIHSVIENSWASVDWLIWFLVFNATFSNISAISWRPALVVQYYFQKYMYM